MFPSGSAEILNVLMTKKFRVFLSVLIFLLTGLWLWMRYYYNYWKRYNIPFIKPIAIFGNIKEVIKLQKPPCDQFDNLYRHNIAKDQKAVGIFIFHRPSLLLRDLELIKAILVKDFNKFTNRFSAPDPHTDSLGAENLFFAKNPKWKQIRVRLTPVFTSCKIRQMFPLMNEIGCELNTFLTRLTRAAPDSTIMKNVKDITSLYATDIISSVAYGLQANSLKNPNGIFHTNGNRIFNFTRRRAFEVNTLFFLPELVRVFGFKLFSGETTTFLRDLLRNVLDERMKSGIMRNDLIDILLNFRREVEADTEKKHYILEGDSLVAQAAIFFSAGFENASATISYSLYELAHHPELQERLRNEINDVLQENDGVLSYDLFTDMPFLNNVIQEVLRLYPVMPFLDRECTLDSNEAAHSLRPHLDFDIPHGMPVYVPIFSLHRDSKYFPEPERFNPDRFSREQLADNNMSAYMPFGLGMRNCIGQRFGVIETKIGLINFLRNHRVSCCDKTPTMKFNPRAQILQPRDNLYLNIIYDPLLYTNKDFFL